MRLRSPARGNPPPPGAREEITEFSSASRRRLLLFMATIQRTCLPWMVTLTYPGHFSPDERRWKRDLDAWLKRLKREHPTVAAIWKLEFQQRGAPHFHLFLWSLPIDDHWSEKARSNPVNLQKPLLYSKFVDWLSRSWYEVVASGDEKHLRAGTRFERIRSPQGIMRYVAGYMSKDDQTAPGQNVGRYWGAHNRAAIPTAAAVVVPVDPVGYQALRRTARRFMLSKRKETVRNARAAGRRMRWPRLRNNQSLALLCDVDVWLAKLPAIVACALWWREVADNS